MTKTGATDDFYKNIGTELAGMGIEIPTTDIYLLVKVVLKNLVLALDSKDKFIRTDNAAIVRRTKDNELKLKYNSRLFKIKRKFTITDNSNIRILEKMFLPLLEIEAKELGGN